MKYLKLDDSNASIVKYPYTLADARTDYPKVSFPRDLDAVSDETLLDFHVARVVEILPPVYDPATQNLTENNPVKNGAYWEQSWTVSAKTQQEIDDYQAEQNRITDEATIKADAQLRQLVLARPQQISNYIDNNVTDLASAKEILKLLAYYVSIDAKRTL